MKIDIHTKTQLKKRIVKMLHDDVQREVVIQSAVSLTPDQQDELYRALPSLKHAHCTFETKPELLGGLVIRDGSKIVDVSLKGSLDSIMSSLI